MAKRGGSTHARHVLHENGERAFRRVPQAAIVLDNALMAQILQQLDLALQCAHLLHITITTHHRVSTPCWLSN